MGSPSLNGSNKRIMEKSSSLMGFFKVALPKPPEPIGTKSFK